MAWPCESASRGCASPPFHGDLAAFSWCPERGSNPYAPVKGRRILSPLRLPVSPSGRMRRPGIMCSWRSLPATNNEAPARPGLHRVWRRDPESNRAGRICNPLHNRFAIAPHAGLRHIVARKKEARGFLLSTSIWSGKGGSNSRPQPWQGCALPTELFPRREPDTITEVPDPINGAAHPIRPREPPTAPPTRASPRPVRQAAAWARLRARSSAPGRSSAPERCRDAPWHLPGCPAGP